MKQSEWKEKSLRRLRSDAERLIELIDLALDSHDLLQYSSKRFAAVKRFSLTLNESALEVRRGFYKFLGNK